jgi:hypothetical protein
MVILGNVTVCYGIYSYFYNKGRTTNMPYVVAICSTTAIVVQEYLHRRFLNENLDMETNV